MLWVLAPAQASIEAYEFDSPAVEADYNQLVNELRCLVCQNQNLAGSDADLARDLRRQTYEMLTQGSSPKQVAEYMVERYGDFVLYRPLIKPGTYLLWFGPFVLLGLVIILVVRRLRRASTKSGPDDEAMAKAKQLLQQQQERK